MSTIRRVIKNTGWLTIAEAFGKGIGFVVTIVVARYLGDSEFGKYSFAMATVIVFAVLVDFGFHVFLAREISRNKDKIKEYISNITFLKIIFSIITYLILVGFLFIVGKPDDVKYFVYLSGIYMILNSFNVTLRGIYQGVEKMQYHAINYILEKIIYILLIFLFVTLDFGIPGIMYALIISSAIGLSYNIITVFKKFTFFLPKFKKSTIKFILKESSWFLLTGIFVAVYFKIDIVMLSIMKTDEVVGHYNAAYNLLFAFLFIPGVLTMPLLPVFSRYYKNNKDKLKKLISPLITYFLIAGAMLVFIFITLGPIVVGILYGQEFEPTKFLFQLLSFSFFFVFINYLLSALLSSVNKQKYSTIAAFVAMLINIIINLILIPKYGAAGAAIATIATEATVLLISIILLNRAISHFSKNNIYKYILLAASLIISSFALYYLYFFNAALALTVSLIILIILIILFKIVNLKDMKSVLSLIQKKD